MVRNLCDFCGFCVERRSSGDCHHGVQQVFVDAFRSSTVGSRLNRVRAGATLTGRCCRAFRVAEHGIRSIEYRINQRVSATLAGGIMATTSELLDSFVESFNTDRFEEAEQDYAANGYSEEIGTNRRFTPAEATANARDWKAAFPDAHGTITSRIVEGNRGAAEIEWRGTNRGPLMGQPATGRSIAVRAVLIIETNGAKVTRSSHYIDVAGMMAQLGVASAV
jgi:steroid delta-isomerase-like uncharacterized protein